MLVYHPTKFSCYRGYESKDKFINVFIPYRDGCHWRLLGSIRACWSFILLNIVVECWRTFGIGDKAINGSRVFFKKVGVTIVLAAETTKPTAFLFLSDTTSYNKIKVNRNNSSTHEENFQKTIKVQWIRGCLSEPTSEQWIVIQISQVKKYSIRWLVGVIVCNWRLYD